jgi:magnesium transporter
VSTSSSDRVGAMDVRFVSGSGTERCTADQLPAALARDDGFVWVDLPVDHPDTERVLADVFGFHPRAVRDCLERNSLPKVHVYPDHVLVVLHAPQLGRRGHVHYVELDQVVSARYLVTVHGPINPAVPAAATRVETDAVAARLDTGRLRPASAFELSSSIVSALTVRMRDHLAERTTEVWRFEQQVTAGQLGDAERFLDGMFRVRHGLLTVRTMASLSHEIYGRMSALAVYGESGQPLLRNSLDQFERLATMAHSQGDYMQGVIEFYQTRTHTKMAIAAERLAVIAAITLPITAVSSVMGMNVIVNSASDPVLLGVLVGAMVVMSIVLLIWARRRGWW